MKNYICNPNLNLERNADYKRHAQIQAKWLPLDTTCEGIGNIRPLFDTEKNKFFFESTKHKGNRDKDLSMWQVISSPFLLYRLLTTFKAPVETLGPEGYKCIWWITLKHKETGEVLSFGEWKGAAGIWTRFHSSTELPKAFKRDTLEILNYLVSDTCAHPYDGLVAGSVA